MVFNNNSDEVFKRIPLTIANHTSSDVTCVGFSSSCGCTTVTTTITELPVRIRSGSEVEIDLEIASPETGQSVATLAQLFFDSHECVELAITATSEP